MARKKIMIDGNDAAAHVAYKLSEVIAIYPITPSSGMGELSDEWATNGKKNIWDTIPSVTEMQSEGGAAGAVHGALQVGSLTTTFTASQGLLLMIPNMYKIAGELTPAVFHVSARSLAAQALSIFGDHQDVMQVRQTGFGLLASGSVQEVQDLAAITHVATLESRIPFIHFFDGFRTSHEIQKVEEITDEDLKALIDPKTIHAHRGRAMNPEKPVLRGTSQNPDVYFQGRETVNKYYNATPAIVQKTMDKFAEITGRQYNLFDYYGASDATRVVVIMGSGSETVKETIAVLQASEEKVGVLVVRLYRPFSAKDFIAAIPKTAQKIAVLDRTKEPGSPGEPLYLDVVTTIAQAMASTEKPFEKMPIIVGGRYGLSSKEFTPAMVKAVYDNLKLETPKNDFTIGIIDDVTFTSLDFDPTFITEDKEATKCMFYGLGSDGTVGANKNSIKIIGGETDNYAQGYFVYDSKKSGSTTISHLRFGKNEITSTYLIQEADFVGVHLFELMDVFDVLAKLKDGGTFLLNTQYSKEEVWDHLPKRTQKQIIDKKLSFYVIDAVPVAKATGMGARINTIMQTCFFAISGILPKDEAIQKIKDAIHKTYIVKGEDVVQKNYDAVDQSLSNLFQVEYGTEVTSEIAISAPIPDAAPDFVKETLGMIIAGKGDDIPVSQMPADGTYPTATAKWEKRNVGLEVPVWESDICIQCNKCVFACPHAAIRAKRYDKSELENAPETYKSMTLKGKGNEEVGYTIQVAVEDCTGCYLCVEVCPAIDKQDENRKAINMAPQLPLRETERENFSFFLDIPEADRTELKIGTVAGSQFLEPLFEFSGACSGCGETPYVKLVSQLFGDRAIIANATGCSSIYGGNLPTTPWATNKDGQGPTWNNSLFEDNAEFGLGMRLSVDREEAYAKEVLIKLKDEVGAELADAILSANQKNELGIREQRARVKELKSKLEASSNPLAAELLSVADYLIIKSIWIMGGDGWAYDIGFGGLDHVFASGENVNILVLDTEVYSNTGGQASKATGLGAVAKFAAAGKAQGKKDLGKIAMGYKNVYVAQIAMGHSDMKTVKAIMEAEAYDGVSLIIANSPCIAHGYDMKDGFTHQKLAVDSGYWPAYRFNPDNVVKGKNPLTLDYKKPKISVEEYVYTENRFKMLTKMDPERAKTLLKKSQEFVDSVWEDYSHMASLDFSSKKEE
ncbi:MAG: pyruvate:ferredoxin (flavodoxin) oxidoreductase [Melioribacteraceae bacterium]|nr:pyruvate:ferredoxin (flavodoxin) oxidoreductase [Melioribacteraceae bacterium]